MTEIEYPVDLEDDAVEEPTDDAYAAWKAEQERIAAEQTAEPITIEAEFGEVRR